MIGLCAELLTHLKLQTHINQCTIHFETCSTLKRMLHLPEETIFLAINITGAEDNCLGESSSHSLLSQTLCLQKLRASLDNITL